MPHSLIVDSIIAIGPPGLYQHRNEAQCRRFGGLVGRAQRC